MESGTRANKRFPYAFLPHLVEALFDAGFFQEAKPVPFEKDDDSQIDFIATATVRFILQCPDDLRFSTEFKSTHVRPRIR